MFLTCRNTDQQIQNTIIAGKKISSDELINFYNNLASKYPIKSIEDPIFEDDWKSWSDLNNKIGDTTQIVGDDLFVTNQERLSKGIQESSANAILIKLNQNLKMNQSLFLTML